MTHSGQSTSIIVAQLPGHRFRQHLITSQIKISDALSNYTQDGQAPETSSADERKPELLPDSGDKFMDVLLVEDNPGDARLAREAFRNSDAVVDLHIVRDGEAAMEFLHRGGIHINAPRPDLIILDLNLPKLGGREILTKIKYDKNLRTIPTIILTSSDVETDIQYCYEHYANCYFRKPTHWDSFGVIVRHVNEVWLGLAILPGIKA
jgi:CheY-like chemotaxis protein